MYWVFWNFDSWEKLHEKEIILVLTQSSNKEHLSIRIHCWLCMLRTKNIHLWCCLLCSTKLFKLFKSMGEILEDAYSKMTVLSHGTLCSMFLLVVPFESVGEILKSDH